MSACKRAAAAALAAIAATAWAGGADARCDASTLALEKALQGGARWSTLAPGMDWLAVRPDTPDVGALVLFRMQTERFRLRPFDLREVVTLNRAAGVHAPPMYSISELQRGLPRALLVASAGFTKSYSDPIPAGFLRINGKTAQAVAPKDEILDSVVCFARDGSLSILSEGDAGSRRAPRQLDQCTGGFQTGPLLVWEGRPTPREFKRSLPRVFLGLGSGFALLGFTESASTDSLGCMLASSALGLRRAVALQGDALGGIILGPSVRLPFRGLGNIDALIASALIVEPTGQAAR